ncbi:MAG: HPr family phosphocarrier protein [Candidatus Omnitrophica bacterium]|nr:HPr family phosphocarrier protein [Candidatus Omnitrophota bacterium]MBU1997422.1 HPr family phosphocarrier protein [Candidatus Omnitrophota bacterium]MBU4333756.1 HPr family phosphocarrier protein [Candidatus Omnitrophota bacterium]
MPLIRREINVRNPQGLHARPAALFVQIVSKYDSVVTIQGEGEKVNGKSIMGILTLGAQKGADVIIEVEGDDAQIVADELEALLTDEEK